MEGKEKENKKGEEGGGKSERKRESLSKSKNKALSRMCLDMTSKFPAGYKDARKFF